MCEIIISELNTNHNHNAQKHFIMPITAIKT